MESAKVEMNNHHYEEALNMYDQAIKQDPKNESAINNRGIALMRLNRCNESVQTLLHAWQLNSTSPTTLANLVFAELCSGEDVQADVHITEGLDNHSDYVGFWLAKGMLERNRGNLSESIAALNHSLLIEPDNAELWYEQSKTISLLGNFSEAYEAILHARNLSPSDVNILFYQGVLEEQMNRVKDALTTYDSVLALNPNFTPAWFSKGSIYFNHYRPTESINAYNHALQLDPSNSEAWFYRGLALNALDLTNESARSFSNASALNPENRMYRSYRDRFVVLSQQNIDQGVIRLPLSVFFLVLIIGCIFCGMRKKKL